MANLNLISTNQFKARSFDELLKPLAMYTQVYNENENLLSDLNEKASIWEKLKDSELDKDTYELYRAFQNEVKNLADDMSTYGLQKGISKKAKDMKASYNKNIVPIQEAYDTRKKEAEVQRQLFAANPTLRFSRQAANTKLSDYLKNPNLDYDTLNGNVIAQQTSVMAKQIQDDLMSEGDNATKAKLISAGVPYQYIRQIQRGMTKEQLNQFMQDPRSIPILWNIAESVLNANGVYDWAEKYGDKDAVNWALEYIKQGMWSAEGTQTEQVLTDSYNMQLDLEEQKAKRQLELEATKAALKNQQDLKDILSNSHSYLQGELNEGSKSREAFNAITNVDVRTGKRTGKSEYYGKDGKANPMKIYEEAEKIFSKIKYKGSMVTNPGGAMPTDTNDEIYEAASTAIENLKKKYGVTKLLTSEQYNALKNVDYDGNVNLGKQDEYIDNVIRKAVQQKLYYTLSSGDDYKHVNEMVGSYINSNDVKGYEYDTQTGKQGEHKKLPEIKSNKNVIEGVSYNPAYPDKIMIQMSDGHKTYLVDPNVFSEDLVGPLQIAKSRLDITTNPDERKQIIANAMAYIHAAMNNFNQVKGSTDSKLD